MSRCQQNTQPDSLRKRYSGGTTFSSDACDNPPVEGAEVPPQKSLLVAYLMYFCGGFFGLHHFYLGRDDHAILWCTTFGGCFVGVIRDFWRLPDYVKAANREKERQDINQREQKRPSSWAMFFALLQLPRVYRQVVLNVCPRNEDEGVVDPWFMVWTCIAGPLSVACAVTWISKMAFCWNSSFTPALLGAIVGELINVGVYLYPLGVTDEDDTLPREQDLASGTYCIMGAILGAYASRSFVPVAQYYAVKQHTRNSRSLCRRMTKVVVCVSIFYLLLGTALYQNGAVTTTDGTKVKIRDSVQKILNSPVWARLQVECAIAIDVFNKEGYHEFSRYVMDRLDINGEQRAFRDLGLPEHATSQEIRASANTLRKLYHPDRCTLPADECVRKFQDVQNAFKVLMGKDRK